MEFVGLTSGVADMDGVASGEADVVGGGELLGVFPLSDELTAEHPPSRTAAVVIDSVTIIDSIIVFLDFLEAFKIADNLSFKLFSSSYNVVDRALLPDIPKSTAASSSVLP